MTHPYLWNRYLQDCMSAETQPYQYRHSCNLDVCWCKEIKETMHFHRYSWAEDRGGPGR